MNKVGNHPCIAGTLHDSMFKFEGSDGTDYIGSVDYHLAPNGRYHIKGQFLMVRVVDYDIVAFSLLREMFGLEVPRVLVVSYNGEMFILVKRFGCRELRDSDYYPPTADNYQFRFQLALIIYFCKFVGCSIGLNQIRVLNGVPFFWRCGSLGYRNSPTITEDQFSIIFEIDIAKARQMFVSQHDKLNIYDAEETNALTGEKVLINDSNMHDELYDIKDEVEYDSIKGTIFDKVIVFFRAIDFDMDVMRECLYMKENPVRSSSGNRKNFTLSRNARNIAVVIEENHSLLMGPYPFKIFRLR